MYETYLSYFYKELPIGESFDLLERKLVIGGRKATLFFVDGLTDGELMQRVIEGLLRIQPGEMEGMTTSQQFISRHLPFLDASLAEPKKSDEAPPRNPRKWDREQIKSAYEVALTRLYSGLVPILVEGLDQIIIIDGRNYPSRSVDEPEKEKSLRGAKDGFTEGFMTNIALIRRRLRDNRLIFRHFNVGQFSKTDVALIYMKEKADEELVEKISNMLQDLEEAEDVETLTVGDQSLLEKILLRKGRRLWNPFPKVRYSQRPDIISAHVAEGKLAILVDNSPTVMLVPVGIFDFLQDVDDYYFPKLTGNYFRLIRLLNFMLILFLTPVYLLLVENENLTPEVLRFFVPQEDFAIPLFWQFMLLEFAVDGLKLASLNTPESLGMSLSVIGALLLGEFSISSGWFIPQTILCMAVVALAGFTQPSIELSYSVKFVRIFMLIGVYLLGVWGIVLGVCTAVIIMATTQTLSGCSYLYPLVPLDMHVLKRLIFRVSM